MARGRGKYKSAEMNKIPKVKFNWFKLILILVGILFVAYIGYTYVNFLNIKTQNPLNGTSGEKYLISKNSGSFKKTLIVFESEYEGKQKIEKVYLYAENKEKGASILIYLPSWVMYRGLESDFGNAVAVSGFRYAGDFIKPGKGIEYAIWQLEEVLGLKIDDYIWFDAKTYESIRDVLGEVITDTVYSQYYENGNEVSEEVFFLNGFVSRLGWVNLLVSGNRLESNGSVLYSSFNTLPSAIVQLKSIHKSILSLKPYVIDFSQSRYLLQEESDAGAGISSYIKTNEFDIQWREKTVRMIDKGLEKERVRVEVYNASGIAGKASSYARRIANSGCEVVRFDNAPNNQEKTQFHVPNEEEFKISLGVVGELFPGVYEILSTRPSFMTTGDIVIILGEDISKIYSF